MSDPNPTPEPSPLATATFDELVQELKTRCAHMVFYGERLERGQWQYCLSRTGDIVRLWGAMELRVMPELWETHAEMFKFQSNHDDDGDDKE